MKNNSKTWLAVTFVLVFAAGALAGALGGYIRARGALAGQCPASAAPPDATANRPWKDMRGPGGPGKPDKQEIKRMFLSTLEQELSLNKEQLDQSGEIFEAQHTQVMALRDDMQARFQAIEDDTVRRISGILDDSQKAKLDKIVRERRAMRDKDGDRPPLFMLKHKDHTRFKERIRERRGDK